jgi:hypothetical protein
LLVIANTVALQTDLILSHSTPTTATLLQQTRSIPIIFAFVFDPLGSGFVVSFPRLGWQRYRFHCHGAGHGQQMVGAAQGDCASRCSGYFPIQPTTAPREAPLKRSRGAGSSYGRSA